MAPADPPSTVPGQHTRSADPDDPALLDLTALEEAARGILPAPVADYYAGGAESEITLIEASAAWRSWRLRPRVLRGTSTVRLTTSLLAATCARR